MVDLSNASPDESLPAATSGLNFPVVGLGASAGGLAALRTCFENLPAAPDMAFVVILHLSPKHESNVAAILQHATRMPVSQVASDIAIERNHVYVIPPTHSLAMYDGHLALSERRNHRGAPVSIDLFFRTLAEAHGDRAVGIVLSGTGADGSGGIARLKERGGVVIAQSPADAEFSGMPDSAIATGNVDIVLPVADIAQKLVELWQNARGIALPTPDISGLSAAGPSTPDAADEAEAALQGVMGLLKKRTGHDFKHYKRATVLRRIERRLQVAGVSALPSYLEFMNGQPGEANALLDDMLIGVTNFFRDRESFEALEREVIPTLFAPAFNGEPLRAWVAGCSSGEEVYSLAILLADAATRATEARELQLFASDIDESALAVGRQGRYPEAIATDVAPNFLRSYFCKEGIGYRVHDALRKKVLFAAHNVLRDPPFSRLDMVSCRNLLIYLDREAQSEILQTFHFSLRPGGYLFLGSSETADAAPRLFSEVDKKHRIYRALPGPRAMRELSPFRAERAAFGTASEQRRPVGDKHVPSGIKDLVQTLLVEDYTPATLVIDADLQVVHVWGGAARFLRFGEGDPSHHLLSLVPEQLRAELRTAIFQATQSGASVTARPVTLAEGTRLVNVHTTVRPVHREGWPPNLSLVLFSESSADSPDADAEAIAAGAKDPVVIHLESELHRKEELLQATLEQHATAVEDLKATNEELQAINEEMRSTTEELETSKEELQSTNEELMTVNVELKNKIDETNRVTDDLRNLVRSSEIASIFVDPEMRIRRFTPAAQSIFNIIGTDIGRPLLDITHRLDYDGLANDAAATFASLRTVEREVRSSDGRWFLARMLPYRTAENNISGAVLNFVDISSRLVAETRMHLGEERLKLLADSVPDFAILTLDGEARFSSWSGGAERLFGYVEAEILGRPADVIYTSNDRERAAPTHELSRADDFGSAFFERWLVRKDGTEFFANATLAALRLGGAQGYGMIVRDVTKSKETEGIDEASKRAAEATAKLKDEFLAVLSHELKHPLNLIHVNAQLLLSLPETKVIPSVAKAGETIERSVAAQARIIDDLLDLSRTQAGKLALDRASVDLVQAIEPSLKWAQFQTDAKGIELALEGLDQTIVVFGDVVRIEQIIWNLVSNAIKFTDAGGQIVVRLRLEGQNAVVEVADTGRGMSAAFLPHVFDMFRQEEGYTTRREGGMGIGLGLVKALVKLHGGSVVGESAGTGQGSTFTVSLPILDNSEVAQPHGAIRPARPLGGMRILLVDDTSDTLDTFSILLEMEGAVVACAGSGAEALALCRNQRFDLLISDVGMPEMDGNQLIARLRRRTETARLPAIALTGYGRTQDIQAATQAGFNAHLTKPVDLDKLRELALKVARVHP
ncbi:MAG: PAS domain-containing protein [Proteobacteria bacterium]|nr:PAS domain-containing protein [Burkholderiales bacterium]